MVNFIFHPWQRDDFNFHITNFPFLRSNIPSSPAYGVFISQLIRYARACSSYECFLLRARQLSSKLLKQGYLVERLKSPFRKFYGRYGDLIQQYEVSLSRILNDILTLDSDFSTDQTFHQFRDLCTGLDLHRIMSGFHGAIATGVTSQQGTLSLPDTWFCPLLGLACATIVETIFLELAMSLLDFSTWIPLVLSRFRCLQLRMYHCRWTICAPGYLSGSNYTYMNDEENEHESGVDVAHYRKVTNGHASGHGHHQIGKFCQRW